RRQPSARPPPSCPAPLSYHAARPSSPPVYPSLQVRMGHDRARAPRECLEEREFPSCEPAPDPTKLRLARGGVSWGPVPARRTGIRAPRGTREARGRGRAPCGPGGTDRRVGSWDERRGRKEERDKRAAGGPRADGG